MRSKSRVLATMPIVVNLASRIRRVKDVKNLGVRLGNWLTADKVMRTPLSKQRNKHLQRTLVEAAKLAPRQCLELAVVYENEKQRRNGNLATLAVVRKMVAYMLAGERRKQDFVAAEEFAATAAA